MHWLTAIYYITAIARNVIIVLLIIGLVEYLGENQ
jgi:hypothetical protein